MLRRASLLTALLLFAATPVFAQALDLTGDQGGQSTATVTTEQTPINFTGPYVGATVLSAVNVRNAPTSHGSSVIGTLSSGEVVNVRCAKGWCELEGSAGYAAFKFFSVDSAPATDAQTFTPDDTQMPVAELSDQTQVSQLPMADGQAPQPGPNIGNFDGLWTVLDESGQPGMPLILAQTGATVTGTLQGNNRLTKIVGDVQGKKLTFTYDMVNAKNAPVASGNGFLNIVKDGAGLSGVLMLNGLVIANLNATR